MTTARLRFGSTRGVFAPAQPQRPVARASVLVVSPNGGEVYDVGEEVVVSWTITGSFQSFDVALSTDAGASWVNLATGLASTVTSYEWTTDEESEQCLIRVTGHNVDASASDRSNAVFTVENAEVVWPGSTRPEAVSYCVSSVMADAGITDSGSPLYTITNIVDQETGYGGTGWSGETALARSSALHLAFGGAASSAYATKSPPTNLEGLYTLLGTGSSTVSGSPNWFGSFIVRCTEVGVYGWFGTSFAQQNYIKITSTQVQWTHGKSDSGYETLSLSHGLDTSIYRTWICVFEGNSFPSATWYADNVLIGTTANGIVNYDFPMTSPDLRLGRASGAVTSVLAAAFVAKQLSAGERASFQS